MAKTFHSHETYSHASARVVAVFIRIRQSSETFVINGRKVLEMVTRLDIVTVFSKLVSNFQHSNLADLSSFFLFSWLISYFLFFLF